MEMVAENENWEELDSLAAAYLEIAPDAPLVLYLSVAAAANLDNLELLRERIDRLEALGETDYLARSYAMAGEILEHKTNLWGGGRLLRGFHRGGSRSPRRAPAAEKAERLEGAGSD